MIAFNKPFLSGQELDNIKEAVRLGMLSGNGQFTKFCQHFLENKYDFSKVLLTTSCTDALEMAAILLDIREGDEVIVPAYTFVSTANAFVLRGARIVFVDSRADHPGMDEDLLENLITERTKAIVPVHYAGVACDMDKIMRIAEKHKIFVVEDAAQAIDAKYRDRALGSFGDMACFSFHETKNISSGEGGALVINNPKFIERAEIIWEKGTNRAAFWRGEVDKYSWVDVGSSFLPSELNAAYLAAQLENLEQIQAMRKAVWDFYHGALEALEQKAFFKRPLLPHYASNNAHMYYLVLPDLEARSELIAHLKADGVYAVFHYIALHNSPFGAAFKSEERLSNAEYFTDSLLRLPLYAGLGKEDQHKVVESIRRFFG